MGDTREDDVAALRAEVVRLRAALGDATARADRVDAELVASRALHQATIESLPFDFWARDREGYCVSQNRTTREHWGDLLHRRPEDMDLPPEVIETWLANNRRALGGEIVRGEVDYTIGGELRHFQNVLGPIRQGDAIVGTLGVNIDLTDLRRAEADRLRLERRLRDTQRLETIGLLAGGVAHDINNIVMIVLGLASLARRHADPGGALDRDLATIETASRRAAEICSQLLAFAGRGQLALEPVDLSALVAETLALVKPGIAEGIEVELDAPAALGIVGDATQLRQLVMNLVLNASDAIGESPGRIRIRVAHADRAALAAAHELELAPDHSYALVEVSDTGRGMSDQIRARIFEPFYTTKIGGRGLGLAAALGTVRGHHGALTVESQEGLGSTFRVFLPSVTRELSAPAPSSDPDDWRGAGLVLIVDDDRGVATAAARMVTEMGFEVLVATSGHEAVACVTAHPEIVLALVDLRMPGLGGAATYAGLQRHQPGLPVILMSGFHDRAERPDGTQFLAKPFSLDELTHAIRGAMQSTILE